MNYVETLLQQKESFFVDFESCDDDPPNKIDLKSQNVKFNVNDLVFGFGNSWTKNNKKAVFFPAEEIGDAFQRLNKTHGRTPRGVGFWVVEEEGNGDLFYTGELKKALSGMSNNCYQTDFEKDEQQSQMK